MGRCRRGRTRCCVDQLLPLDCITYPVRDHADPAEFRGATPFHLPVHLPKDLGNPTPVLAVHLPVKTLSLGIPKSRRRGAWRLEVIVLGSWRRARAPDSSYFPLPHPLLLPTGCHPPDPPRGTGSRHSPREHRLPRSSSMLKAAHAECTFLRNLVQASHPWWSCAAEATRIHHGRLEKASQPVANLSEYHILTVLPYMQRERENKRERV